MVAVTSVVEATVCHRVLDSDCGGRQRDLSNPLIARLCKGDGYSDSDGHGCGHWLLKSQ